jgi:hypothetical protein
LRQLEETRRAEAWKREFVASSSRDCSRPARDVGYAEIVSPAVLDVSPSPITSRDEPGESGKLRENLSLQNSNLESPETG